MTTMYLQLRQPPLFQPFNHPSIPTLGHGTGLCFQSLYAGTGFVDTRMWTNRGIKDFHVRRKFATNKSWMIFAVNGRENFSFSEEGLKSHNGSYESRYEREETSLSWSLNASDEQESKTLKDKGIGNEGEDPYRILESGRKVYLDELDVITLLDPPSYLIPYDANNYNKAAYLWKKIGDIPEERRHNLLELLTPKQVASMWEIAGWSSGIPDSSSSDPESILLGSQSESFMKPVTWTGRAFTGSRILDLFSAFQKVFFLASDGSVYGRVILGGGMIKSIARILIPLYFEVREIRKVVATEEACNIAFEYGDGQLHLEVPQDFPRPAAHPWPFNDASFDYVRPVGPGVLVGQWWIEGKDLEQMPEKRADFVLIRNCGGK